MQGSKLKAGIFDGSPESIPAINEYDWLGELVPAELGILKGHLTDRASPEESRSPSKKTGCA